MSRRSRRGASRPAPRVRPGLLVVCVLALVATAGIRVAAGADGDDPAGVPAVDLAPPVTVAPRPAGVAPEAPERNPFGTPGGPATSPDPDAIAADPTGATEATVDAAGDPATTGDLGTTTAGDLGATGDDTGDQGIDGTSVDGTTDDTIEGTTDDTVDGADIAARIAPGP